MSLTFLNLPTLLSGLAAVGLILYWLQRLRVRHREIEIITTLFWREAVEERSVRVLRRRFRHLAAYVLLLAIAALLWLLVAGPQAGTPDGARHVVLLDGSAAMSRDGRFGAAIDAAQELAAALPPARRSVRLVAGGTETLLGPREALPLLAARLEGRLPVAAPGGFEAALLDLAAGATAERPVHAYLLGDAPVADPILDRLPESVLVHRAPLDGTLAPNAGIVGLGLADGDAGAWETVDVAFEIAPAAATIPARALAVTLDGAAIDLPVERVAPGRFRIRGVPARGGRLAVRIVDPAVAGAIALDDTAAIVLPDRPRIAVWLEPGAPEALRHVLALDPGIRVVDDRNGAEVTIGAGDDADLHLANDDAPAALTVTTATDGDASASAPRIVDELALRQIDADALADQAARAIRLDVVTGARRRIAVWRSLFTETYDFRASRAFPVFLARAVRWLAARPALVPWVGADDPIPAVGTVVLRPARAGALTLPDGRAVEASLLDRRIGAGARTDGAPVVPDEGRGPDLFGLLGLLAVALGAVEWSLYQRGRIP